LTRCRRPAMPAPPSSRSARCLPLQPFRNCILAPRSRLRLAFPAGRSDLLCYTPEPSGLLPAPVASPGLRVSIRVMAWGSCARARWQANAHPGCGWGWHGGLDPEDHPGARHASGAQRRSHAFGHRQRSFAVLRMGQHLPPVLDQCDFHVSCISPSHASDHHTAHGCLGVWPGWRHLFA
jgi:hypothetical protein